MSENTTSSTPPANNNTLTTSNSATITINGIFNNNENTSSSDIKNIPFSMGLENLQITDGISNNTNGNYTTSTPMGRSGNEMIANSNIGSATLGQLSGNWVSDVNLKQVGMIMTVFQSFPVTIQGESNPYTMVVDATSTSDGAGTNHGELAIGVLGCPDGYNIDLLKKVASNTKGGGFKVGVSCWNKRAIEYMQHFYGDIMTERQFNTLRRKCLMNVEVVVPTSGNTGASFRAKIVDEGPHFDGKNGMWKLDVMGAFCMLNQYNSLFKIQGKYNGKFQTIDNSNIVFPFKDNEYDILTGEIKGYTPEAMLNFCNSGQVNSNTSLINRYYGGPIGNDGDNICRVRFYIEPDHRAEAEKVCGHSLPDDLFKYNGTNTLGSISQGTYMVGSVADASIQITNATYQWPIITQAKMRSNSSEYGSWSDIKNNTGKYLKAVPVPSNYPMKTSGGATVSKITVHYMVADRLKNALTDVANHYIKLYGPNFNEQVPGICIYDGCFNSRPIRGGKSMSIHSWGIALDFDASKNAMSTKSPTARFSQPQYDAFIQIMNAHGFTSLGKERNYDWMHFQAATLK